MKQIKLSVATKSELTDEFLEYLKESQEAERDAFFNSEEDEGFILEESDLLAYTTATYEETVINRLDNILTMNILSCCFLFLLFFYTVKRK